MTRSALLDGWSARLRSEIPGIVAVILKGSYARGDAGPRSDIDVDVLVANGMAIAHPYLTWLDDDGTGRLVQVSVAVEPLDAWLAGFSDPASWSFGLPATEAATVAWAASDTIRSRIEVLDRTHPAGDPELEDTIECLGKARNARDRADHLAMRLHLHDMALLVPSLLVALNPPVRPGTRPEALAAILAFPVAPERYRDDMLVCLGLDMLAGSPEDTLAAGTRLVMGTLDLLEQHADTVCPLQPPYLGEMIANRTLRRYLEQGTPEPGLPGFQGGVFR